MQAIEKKHVWFRVNEGRKDRDKANLRSRKLQAGIQKARKEDQAQVSSSRHAVNKKA
jgi:hypothetical protein